MISERQLNILKWIVEEYVRTAEPVGSKALSEQPQFDYSSATIRNDMAALEEQGYLLKTHTSSGRVPSVKGYKLYVSEILNQKNNDEEEFPMIDEIFKRNETSREEAIKESMSLVSQLTNYASIALGGSSYNARIKSLQIVKLSESSAVMVMVTDQGYVESRKIYIPDSINFKDIDKVIKLLNETLHDCPINQIDLKLKEIQNENNIQRSIEYYDELVGVFVRAVSEMVQDKFFMSGQTNILKFPEFQDIEKARNLFDVMNQDDMFKLISLNNQDITVNIGKDNQLKAMQDCTVITVPYQNDNGIRGAIAVIGPTRMEYQKVIPLLDYIAKYLGKL
ncbi:MAG: heat-inducible transcriptional repressor HrcA [Bacilli bacterium]|nr:heat-inducible transcriptional repressor HrcA [Acholeplasmataceae bacterium]MDY2902896.1 heat-inducible transcriptional repressor HrcA [Bacilli bacterium]